MRVSEIRVKRIRVKQGLGVHILKLLLKYQMTQPKEPAKRSKLDQSIIFLHI